MPDPERQETTLPKREPGVCVPWDEKIKELPEITGDKALVEEVWKNVDALAYVYIWHLVLSF
jgi:hypothetical protein